MTSATEVSRRNTAVTLNYCRAALHRIRRAPSKKVLLEEQQRILNNLDLNQIDDPEVISLYRSILDEIGQVEISDRERVVIGEQFTRGVQRKMGTDFFVIGAQVATGQLGSVIQTGANSWWDYRSTQIKRDTDMWQVEKIQFTTLMSRSSTFMDSFWKLSRKNEIPDRWLLRDQDLDQLSDTLEETGSGTTIADADPPGAFHGMLSAVLVLRRADSAGAWEDGGCRQDISTVDGNRSRPLPPG